MWSLFSYFQETAIILFSLYMEKNISIHRYIASRIVKAARRMICSWANVLVSVFLKEGEVPFALK